MTNNSIKAAFQRFWEHVVAQLNGKADVNHTHDYADSVHNHDDLYYTESEIDAKLSEVSESIDNLTYSWNDLEDKPFYEETGEVFICEEEEIYIGETGFNWSVSGEPLVIGQEYTVAINGQEYTSIVKEDANGVICCGNTTLFRGEDFSPSGEDTGEPFVFANRWSSDKKFECFFAETLPDSITFAISTVKETVNYLDEKFIPDTIARAKHTHSWNDLEDRPFGEEKNYIWSGTYADMESLETRIIGGDECVRVSDFIEVEDLNQAEYIMYENGKPLKKSETFDLDDFNFESNYVKCSWVGIYVVSNSFEDNGVTVPFGLWIRKDEWRYVGEIYRLIIKQLDEKFIPNTIARAADIPIDYAKENHTHSWDDLEDTPFSEIMENTTLLPERVFNVPPRDWTRTSFPSMLILGETYTVTIDGTAYEVECTYNDEYGEQYELRVRDDFYIYQEADDTTIYLSNSTESLMTVSVSIVGLGKTGEVLDEEYIPNTIARVSDIPEGFSGSWNDLTDKPFGEVAIKGNSIFEEVNAPVDGKSSGGWGISIVRDVPQLVVGETYIVVCDGIEYTCVAEKSSNNVYAGDPVRLSTDGNPVLPFTIRNWDGNMQVFTGSETWEEVSDTHTISLYNCSMETIPLDVKFIPDTIARKTDVEPALSLATEAIILNTETISLHTEQIAALQTEVATIVEITKEEVDALFALTE